MDFSLSWSNVLSRCKDKSKLGVKLGIFLRLLCSSLVLQSIRSCFVYTSKTRYEPISIGLCLLYELLYQFGDYKKMKNDRDVGRVTPPSSKKILGD